jgi:hypothetical protein
MDAILEGASILDYTGQVVIGETKITGASTLKRK